MNSLELDVFLRGIAYEVGEPCAIENLATLSEPVVQALRKKGLRTFSKATRPPAEMLARCVDATLTRARLDAESIDGVVWCTAIPTWSIDQERAALKALQSSKVPRRPVFGVHMSSCANANAALAVGAGLIRSGQFRNLLFVAYDVMQSDDMRLTPPDLAIAGDAIASCIISRDEGDYRLLRTATVTHPGLCDIDQTNHMVDAIELHLECIEAVRVQLLQSDLKTADFSALFGPNVNVPMLQMLAALNGFNAEQLWIDNIATKGHLLNCDSFVNLCDYAESRGTKAGDLFYLHSTGDYSASGAVVAKM